MVVFIFYDGVDHAASPREAPLAPAATGCMGGLAVLMAYLIG